MKGKNPVTRKDNWILNSVMKKGLSLILTAVIVIALILMGIMEKTLSKTGSNVPIIIIYSFIAVILIILYIKARKDAGRAADETSDAEITKEEITPSDKDSEE